MEGAKILSVSDLLQRSRPLTGTASLHTPPPSISRENPEPSISSAPSPRKRKSQSAHGISYENPLKPLESLKFPAIIIGTVHLPTVAADPTAPISCYSKHNCLWFSDGSSAVCCAPLDPNFNAISKRIRVLAWNFIPFRPNGGLLEIIRWDLLEPMAEISRNFPLVSSPSFSSEDPPSARSYICGRLDSISPISSVPCTVQSRNSQTNLGQSSSGSANMVGFLSEMTVCECTICTKEAPIQRGKNSNCHSFMKRVLVYFIGSASGWRPLLSKLLGRTISVVGLKKKLVFIGRDESYLMFVTTEKAAFYLPQLLSGAMPVAQTAISRRGEVGTYMGVVTGVYFQGMVVELDGKVWLLVSDRVLALPHSLRVGAVLGRYCVELMLTEQNGNFTTLFGELDCPSGGSIMSEDVQPNALNCRSLPKISLSNVHFILPKFSWVRVLLLGCCVKTNINVKSFSPLETQCLSRSQMQSLLGKFIESLKFSARFWVLLTVSCFRKKFSGIFSDKEILGSKQRGAFTEFCKHDAGNCGNEPELGLLKLAVPMSNFISKCEAVWRTLLLEMQSGTARIGMNNYANLLPCEGGSFRRFVRRIISSEDLGVVLVGTLKVCPNSGRLQLVDATGSIDVVVPDLLSNGDVDNVYEVKDYRIILEGLHARSDPLEVPKDASFSCKSIFSRFLCNKPLNQLTTYVHFYLKNATCLNVPLSLPHWKDHIDDFNANRGGAFHLMLVTHKFPAIWNFQGAPIISNRSSSFAEAIIFPYDLFLPGENGDKLKLHLKYADRKNFLDEFWSKKRRITHGSNRVLPRNSKENLAVCNGQYTLPTDYLSLPLELSCSLSVRSVKKERLFIPGILFCSNRNYNVVDKPSGQKVLLEFNSESFNKYQLLRIGVYYILKYTKEAVPSKALVTLQTPVWSLSFISGEVIQQSEPPQEHLLEDSPVGNEEVPFGKFSSVRCDEVLFQNSPQGELLFQRSSKEILETLSDVRLHLSAESKLLEEERKAFEDGLIRSFATFGEAVSVSTCIQEMEASRRPFGASDVKCRLSEGNLISLYGDVADVHSFQHRSVSSKTYSSHGIVGDIHQGFQNRICIHVHEDHHMVRICGSISTSSYPIGMGPGVQATFHRVLIDSSSRQCELMLTSVSFIVINSTKEVVQQYNEGFCPPPPNSDILNEEFSDIVSSNLISQLILCSENSNPIRLRCRVVAVLILVLKKDPINSERPGSREQLEIPAVNIPLAGFVIDDGSSSCCCWADAERASSLLRLQETPVRVSNGSYKMSKRTGSSRTKNNTADLQKMLKRHHSIMVKNCGTALDSSCLDLTFSVGSNQVFSSSEESLLKSIILKACCGSVLSVVGTVMHSNAIRSLEREIREMHVTLGSMQNVWAREVELMDPLAEARNTINNL